MNEIVTLTPILANWYVTWANPFVFDPEENKE